MPEIDEKTAAANFDRWFKGSKAVCSAGHPLAVYHGTESDFSVFDPKLAGSQQGKADAFWFTSSFKNAGFYGPKIMTVHLSMQKPLVVDAADPETVFFRKSPSHIARFAKSMGYDGVVIQDTVDGSHPGDTFVVFHADQIKTLDAFQAEHQANNARQALAWLETEPKKAAPHA